MNSDGSGTVLGFTNPVVASETALFSFNPLVYLYFMLSFLLVPYPLYRWVAARYKWETNTKSSARHWSDLMLGISYGTLLFVFGNYSKAYSWITVVAFYPALFGYALIAELPFTKTSLPNIKHWPYGMWVVFLTAVGIVLAFAAFHIYYAATLASPFVAFYVCSLIIPLFLFMVAIALIKENNENWIRTRFKRKDEEELVSAYSTQVGLHLHHWQIFYMLAFFTRFTHPVSQVGAGIVLACYMEGVCAYGYDGLVNDH